MSDKFVTTIVHLPQVDYTIYSASVDVNEASSIAIRMESQLKEREDELKEKLDELE